MFAYLDERTVTLYIDLSGEPLFKRAGAPTRRSAAEGKSCRRMLALSGWTPEVPLLDPFCGSGTPSSSRPPPLPHERAPGLGPAFAFERLAQLRPRCLAPAGVNVPRPRSMTRCRP